MTEQQNKNYILRGRIMEFDAEDLNGVRIKDGTAYIYVPKIINGSTISIGKDFATTLKVDQHFNWFQKLMWKLCFGFKVEDYNEE